MKNLEIYENFQTYGRKSFTDAEIKYFTTLWGWLHFKYTTNPFFSKLWNQVITKKYLSKNQWIELEYLLKNGKSRYEAGLLPPNY